MSTTTSGVAAGFYRQVDLVGRPEVTPEQAATNRATGRGICRPRPGRVGILPFSAPTLWRLVAAGRFPQPVKIGAIAAWPKAAVNDWLDAQTRPPAAAGTDGVQPVRARSRGRFVAAHVGTQAEG